MVLLICVLLIAVLFAAVFRKPLKRFPWIFYLCALALDYLAVLSLSTTFPHALQAYLFYPIQRCFVAFALFALVMFIGVLKNNSRLRMYFMPIRAELSILACIFALVHIIKHTMNYLPKIAAPGTLIEPPYFVSVLLALLISALMLMLGITSFKLIHERIPPLIWKRIQRFAYPFFLLIYLHISLFLLPSILGGGSAAVGNFIFYSALFVLYSILRLRKAFKDHSEREGRVLDSS